LIDAYGMNCYHEEEDGLYFEIGYTNQSYIISWLLGFGDKVKVLEPDHIISEIQSTAKNILSGYSQT
jgi:predicted DNA-binding transcriptional regulator YafY